MRNYGVALILFFSCIIYILTNSTTVQAKEIQLIKANSYDTKNQVRTFQTEEIPIYEEFFDSGESGWSFDSGWQATQSNYYSEDTSMNSPNTDATKNNVWNLYSPVYELPALGDGETMAFSFYLFNDMPDFSQVDDPNTPDVDESGYLADYYAVSILDTDALAWHESSTNAYNNGVSYWCGDEMVGGYLDSWLQYLDTPAFMVPKEASLSAQMKWEIESPAGATVGGSCTDGWDAANVRISSDGGSTWSLLTGSTSYDFNCGYGWIYNSGAYETGGALNHLAAGWGGSQDWHEVSFDLSSYEGQEVIVRFAFGSDPAYSTVDDASLTGFYVDDIVVESSLDCNPEENCDVAISGEVWTDIFYDYGDSTRPGYQEWERYVAGLPFNGNVFLDITEFAQKEVIFRFQARYDDNDIGGTGTGLFIDDFLIYKNSGGSYPAPVDLMGEAGDGQVSLSWRDYNASGTEDIIYDSNSFENGISMTNADAIGWAGSSYSFAGNSTINSIDIYNLADNVGVDFAMKVCVFTANGTLFSNSDSGCIDVNAASLEAGWNSIDVSAQNWQLSSNYIIAHSFSNSFAAALDETNLTMNHSYFNYGTNSNNLGAWDSQLSSDGSFEGEWGIRANISYESANVTYTVYQGGINVLSGLVDAAAVIDGLVNNNDYTFTVSATYPDGEESDQSNTVTLTPFANSVHEEMHDDGIAESYFNVGSSNFAVVKFSAQSSSEQIVRFKWYQENSGGALYLKIFDDEEGLPGDEIESTVISGGLVSGWNEKDISNNTIYHSGDFWIGVKAFSSTSPLGLDESSDMNTSMFREGDTGDWQIVEGNLMIRAMLDCGDNCQIDPSECGSGNITQDSAVNVIDIVHAVQMIVANVTPSEAELCYADLNMDTSLNVLDINLMVALIIDSTKKTAALFDLIKQK